MVAKQESKIPWPAQPALNETLRPYFVPKTDYENAT